MDNALLVGKSLGFAHAMRISEGMSYKHEEIVVKARGKQIQRAIEIAAMLQTRERATVTDTEVGYDDEIEVPTITLKLKTFNGVDT